MTGLPSRWLLWGGGMRRKQLRFGQGFQIAIDNRRAQVAEMVLSPGEREGDARNRHRSADQWLYVVSKTVNFYCPRAYTKAGNELPAGRRS